MAKPPNVCLKKLRDYCPDIHISMYSVLVTLILPIKVDCATYLASLRKLPEKSKTLLKLPAFHATFSTMLCVPFFVQCAVSYIISYYSGISLL